MKFETLYNAIKITPNLDTLKLLKISDKEYFGDGYKDYISNSRLGRLIKKKDKDGNIKGGFSDFMEGASSGEYNSSFDLGSAVHENVLQPEYFMLTPPLDRPSAKAGLISDIIYSYPDHLPTTERIKDAAKKVDYYKGKPSPARINEVKAKMMPYLIKRTEWDKTNTDIREVRYLDNNALEIANGCINALHNNQGVQALLHPTSLYDSDEFLPSENEQAIIVECTVEAEGLEPFIIKLKSKLDNYTINKDDNIITVNDVKTTSKDVEYFGGVVEYFSYNREMAMYSTLLKMVVAKEYGMVNPTIESNFLIVKTFAPYDTGIYTMTPELFDKGGRQFNYLLRLAALAIYFKDYDKYLNYLHGLQDKAESL